MKTVMALVVVLTAGAAPSKESKCQTREFQCEIRCNDTTEGGSMKRLECYDRCREKQKRCLADE